INVPPSIMQGDHNVRAYVTVTAADGSTPSGQVTMAYTGFDGGLPFPHPLVNGATAYTLFGLPAGTYQLTATYAAQGNYQASQARTTLTVHPAGGGGPVATSIAINVPPSIVVNDQNASAVVAVVEADDSIPTGTVGLAYRGFANGQPVSDTGPGGSIPTGTVGLAHR